MTTQLICIGANNPETIKTYHAVRLANPDIKLLGFLDNDETKQGTDFYGYPVLGGSQCVGDYLGEGVRLINLITRDCQTRYETTLEVARLDAQFTNFIHPSVNTEMVDLGIGNYIQENVLLQAGVIVGNNSSIHMGALIGHETRIGSSVFIAHGCNLSGLVNVNDGVFIGTGACILPRVTIGEWSVIGAGAVVRKDVPPRSVIVGNPAKIIRRLQVDEKSGDPFLV